MVVGEGFTTYFVQSAGFGCVNNALRTAAANSERNYLHSAGIHCHEGAVNPSTIIAKRERIRRADRQNVAGCKTKERQ